MIHLILGIIAFWLYFFLFLTLVRLITGKRQMKNVLDVTAYFLLFCALIVLFHLIMGGGK